MAPFMLTRFLLLPFTIALANQKRILVVVAWSVVTVCGSAAFAITYTTLDYPGSSLTNAMGISGMNIVGEQDDVSGMHGFLYDGATWTTLNDPLGTNETVASGVSGSSIVGQYVDALNKTHGFLYNGSTYSPLDDPLAGPNGTIATAISGSKIVGHYGDSQQVDNGFLYNGSSFTTLDDPLADQATPGNGTNAYGISGTNVVGEYFDAAGKGHGFLYNGSSYTTLDDPLGTNETAAVGISGSNIVGYFYDGVKYRGFVYSGGTWQTIDDPLGVATFVSGIDGNRIIGVYNDSAGKFHGFEATVPEPSSIMLAGMALLGVVLCARRSSAIALLERDQAPATHQSATLINKPPV